MDATHGSSGDWGHEPRRRSVRGLLAEAWRLVGRHGEVTVVPALMIYGVATLPALLFAAGSEQAGEPGTSSGPAAAIQLAMDLAYLLVVPVVTFAVGELGAGRRPSL
jgi:hypothetical protein